MRNVVEEFTKIRHSLLTIDLLFGLSGVLLCSVGLSCHHRLVTCGQLLDVDHYFLSTLTIATGAFIFVNATIGWIAAERAQPTLALIFTTCLLVVLFAELCTGIGGYLLYQTADKTAGRILRLPNSAERIVAWDELQKNLNCCGINGVADWGTEIPASCCSFYSKSGQLYYVRAVDECNSTMPSLHRQGCLGHVESVLLENALTFEVIGFFVSVFQLLATASTCYLTNQFRKGYQSFDK